jgi:chemotaxis protein CheD
MRIMNDRSYVENCEKYHLNPGFIYVSMEPTIISTVLGSCVAVCMYDSEKKYGGMNHYLLPKKKQNDMATTKFGNVSIIKLYSTFVEFGSKLENLSAHVVGGAYLENSRDSKAVSDENVSICFQILDKLGIKIVSEDTGGIMGRKLVYFSEYNEIFVAKLQRIRSTDFFRG